MEARGEGLIGILGQNPKCSYAQSVCTKCCLALLVRNFPLATVKLFSGILQANLDYLEAEFSQNLQL